MNEFFNKGRTEAFTDGIFAIIITLLVLEIKVPHIGNPESFEELSVAITGLIPKIASWVLSFFTVAVIWVNHHRIFKEVKGVDSGLFWLNALLLLFTSFIPFPTALLGDYPNNDLAIVIYGVTMMLMALTFSVMRFYILNHGLLHDGHRTFKKDAMMSLLFGPSMYVVGLILGLISPLVGYLVFLAIPVYFVFTSKSDEKH